MLPQLTHLGTKHNVRMDEQEEVEVHAGRLQQRTATSSIRPDANVAPRLLVEGAENGKHVRSRSL